VLRRGTLAIAIRLVPVACPHITIGAFVILFATAERLVSSTT
jgi:hypothetical protein